LSILTKNGEKKMKKHRPGERLARRVMIAVAMFGALCLGAYAQQGTPPEIKIDNFSFTPAAITVTAGTTVTWINRDDIPHTVASDSKEFKSKALDTDEKFSYTFSKAGTYSYFCSLHPKMTGKVIAQ
jgi:plastocyanin